MEFEKLLGEFALVQPKLTTSGGKPVSHFTMKCYFTSGKYESFTYRGDIALTKLRTEGPETGKTAQRMNQLEALILKYRTIEATVFSCKIWNNYNPLSEQLIYCKNSDGTVSIDLLFQELNNLKAIKQASNSR